MATGSGKPGGFPGRVRRVWVEGWPLSGPVPGGYMGHGCDSV
jgi:hypothetical protein